MRKGALLAAVTVTVTLIAAAAESGGAQAAGVRAATHRSDLEAFPSCTALKRYGQRHAEKGRGAGGPRIGVLEDRSGGPAPATPTAGADSSTNVQEAGVDEPDVVKTSGGRIFAVAAGQLHAVDARPSEPRLLDSLPLDGWSHELLLFGDRLLVISQSFVYDERPPSSGPLNDSIAPFYGRSVTRLIEVDVGDPAAMRVVRVEKVDGSYVSARLNDSTARVVISSTPRALYDRNDELDSRLKGWVPYYRLRDRETGTVRVRRAVDCEDVQRAEEFSGLDMLTVLTIDLSRGLPAVDSDALMTSAQIAYASPGSLYLATRRWTPEPESRQDEPPRTVTAIHKFDISDPMATEYRATGDVRGYLLNQWSLSEHRGILRVASTDTPLWWQGAERDESESFVTALDERSGALAEIGRVGGLGRGEQIYAVRFIEDVGFVVTFRQVDPLYTIDLSTPSDPKVVGELKILGYSAYLHPVGDDLLLGVGQDATEQGQRLGTQLSLFDISDLRNPDRLQHRTVAPGSSSEVEYDHHAFLWWAPTKLAVLPVQVYEEGPDGKEPFAGAIGFHIGRASGIDEVGRASHDGDQYPAQVRRSLVVGGRLFTMSEAGLEAGNLATLAEEAWLPFPPRPPDG